MRAKLTCLFLLFAFLQLATAANAQRISLSKKNAFITEVFKEIRRQSGYDFVLPKNLLKQAKPISIEVNNATLEEVLSKCFQDQPFTYTIGKNTIIVSEKERSMLDKIVSLFTMINVKGTVLDENNGPLPGATVMVKSTRQVVITDRDGRFALNGVEEGAVLVVSYIGYQPKEVAAMADLLVKLDLTESSLKEVTINKGYYTTTQELNTGSVSKITAKEIEKQPVFNVLQAMQGRMSGITITQNSGVPGSNFQVRVRGTNSIQNGNDPLYVIDGVPFISGSLSDNNVSGNLYGNNSRFGEGQSPLNSVNPTDIESIVVLKDADATAIYGSRGANGVVLITTKKGRVGKLKFDVNAKSGVSIVTRKLKVMNTEQYLAMREEAVANDKTAIRPDEYDLNGIWDRNRYTDWQEVLLGRTAKMNEVNASLSGGNEQTHVFGALGYNEQSVVFPGNNSARRFSNHFAADHQSVDKKFQIRMSSSYTFNQNDIVAVDMTPLAIRLAPNAPKLYNVDGSLNWQSNTWKNPLAQLNERYKANTSNLISNIETDYELIKGLTLKLTAGYNDIRNEEKRASPSTIYQPSLATPSIANLLLAGSITRSYILEPQLNWIKKNHDSQLSLLIGGTYQNRTGNFSRTNYNGFPSDQLIYNPKSATSATLEAYGDTDYRYAALFGRLSYDYRDRYVLNFTGRRDGSSRFGPGKKFSNFGAAGFGWIFSKTAFVKESLPFMSFGKLRGSIGVTGNDQIGDYKYLDIYFASGKYNNVTSLSPVQVYNPDYGWEKNTKTEIALEVGFLKDRLFLITSYYRNLSSNQLIAYKLAAITGNPSVLRNFPATVENKGFEFDLNMVNIQRKNLNWSSAFNITVPRNKLLSFPGLETSSYSTSYIVGEPLTISKAYHFIGVDPTTGLYKFEDINGDGQVTPADEQSLQKFGPKIFGGFSNTVNFKNFQMDFAFQGVWQEMNAFSSAFGPGNFAAGKGNQPTYALSDYWRHPGDISQRQYFSRNDLANNLHVLFYQSSDVVARKSYYVRLKNLSFSYVFLAKHDKITCRAFLQGQNLWTTTNYNGLDPETLDGGLPPLLTVIAGLHLTF